MFVQVIRGSAKDADALRAAGEQWQKDLRPGAKGYLGVTSGVAADGTAVTIVRFESEAAAQANSDRPEQGKWFEENIATNLENVTFYNCPEVDLFAGGGDNKAGFVQVMIYKPSDVNALRSLTKEFESLAGDRPDLLGGVLAIATDGTVIDTNYFRSEKEAREAEKKEMPPEMQKTMQKFGELAGNVEFIDITEPVMY
jgi:hypothetical protein